MLSEKRISAAIKTIIAALVLATIGLAYFFVSDNYRSIYNLPENKNGVVDLKDYSLSNMNVDAATCGKWEFFYNKWIVTDNLDDKPDFMIDVPGRWTGQKLNGERLKNTGYASYRLTLLNAEPDTELLIKLYNYPVAYKIFVNGKLNAFSGTPSKSSFNSAGVYIQKESPFKVEDSQPIEIVIEISNNNYGGLFSMPWVYDNVHSDWTLPNFLAMTFVIATIGIMAAFVFFGLILNTGTYERKKRLSFVALLFAIFCHLLMTKEVALNLHRAYSVINFAAYMANYKIIFELNFITAIAALACFLINIISQKIISLTKIEWCALGGVCILSAILYYALFGTAYQIIAVIAAVSACLYIVYRLFLAYSCKAKYAASYIIILMLLMSILVAESLDQFGLIVFNLAPHISMALLALVITVSVMMFRIVRDNANKALKAAALETEIARVKHQALKSQIKPHFIFNLLSSIEAQYEKNKADGRIALTRFAQHLRQNIDADNNDLISFEQEIENIMNYVELESLRLDKKLTLLLDIDYSDFMIPVLSLQPLIENAIKHAGLQNKEDGHIRLISRLEENSIIVEVIDNGNGFDTHAVRENAAGLKNCRQRLQFLLSAPMIITSGAGAGTAVKIIIPKKDSKTDENNRS